MYRLTIVIPLWNKVEGLENRFKFISRADSDLVKFLVVDHDSSDGSSEVARKFCCEHSNFEYVWIENHTHNPSEPRNVGLRLCDTDYIMFCDADDIVVPENLPEAIKYLDEHPEVCCYTGNYDILQSIEYNDTEFGLICGYSRTYRKFKYFNIYDAIRQAAFILNGDILRKNHIKWKYRDEIQEDMLFGMEYLWGCLQGETVYHSGKDLYLYYSNDHGRCSLVSSPGLNGMNYIEYTWDLMIKYHPEFRQFLENVRNM